MTDMTAVSAVSDTRSEGHPSPIEPVGTVSARHLARNMATILRAVAGEGHSYAVEHFGRVVGFVVPLDGRSPARRGGKVVYEVPTPEPLRELDENETHVVRTIHRLGRAVPDQLCDAAHRWSDVAVALSNLELKDPRLVVRDWGWYKLRPEGVRHVEELGL
jgi:antitoxin (DNA-binding transcriptional repressor) of toxin-antitoxin stability system